VNYYVSQAANQRGGGLPAFHGIRFQRGNGFFGNLFRNAVMPVLKYLGRRALDTGVGVVQDTITGSNIADATKSRLKRTAQDMVGDAVDQVTSRIGNQNGNGKRKRRIKRKVLSVKKSKPKTTVKRKRRTKNKTKTATIF
jgi:hypothetical protein